jgi:hypothetical protein
MPDMGTAKKALKNQLLAARSVHCTKNAQALLGKKRFSLLTPTAAHSAA